MGKTYSLEISIYVGDVCKIQDKIENMLGNSAGSGYGFGCQDLNYDFNNLSSLKAAARKVRRLPHKVRVWAIDMTDDDYKKWTNISLKGIK